MAGYETTIITKPGCTDDQTAAIKGRIESVIKERGGKVLLQEDWGSRRLTYSIEKESKGNYHYFTYLGDNTTVAELERTFRINESVLRYLSVRVNDGETDDDLKALQEASAMTRPREPRDERGGRGDRDRGDRGDRGGRGRDRDGDGGRDRYRN